MTKYWPILDINFKMEPKCYDAHKLSKSVNFYNNLDNCNLINHSFAVTLGNNIMCVYTYLNIT